MPNTSSLQPIWTPEDARLLAALAAKHPTHPAETVGMRPRRLRRLLTLAGLGAVLAGALLGAGVAKADTTSDAYTVNNAWRVCDVLDAFPSDDGLRGVIQGIENEGLTLDEAASVLNDSVAIACPRNQPVIDGFVRRNAPAAGVGGLSEA